jgi:hypothetical protein
MIILDPIKAVVQKTLLEKMRMSGKHTGEKKNGTRVSAPMSKGDGKGDTFEGGNADLSYLSARTIWSRMISLTVPTTKPSSDYQAILAKLKGENINAQVPDKFKPVVISAGQENTKEIDFGEGIPDKASKKEIEATILTNLGKTRTIGGKLRTNAFGQGDGVYDTENYYRPMAGLKSISTQIKGGTKALKQITVNWTCWDFETLTALTPYFLHPGATVAVEFGWMWPGHTPSNKVYDNWMQINSSEIDNITEAVIEEGRGNQEMLYGLVSNFNWTGRADGGFDCTTTLVSPASNIFGESVGDAEKAETFEFSDEMKNQIRAKRHLFKGRAEELRDFNESATAVNDLELAETKVDDKSIVNIPPRIFFDGLRDELLDIVTKYITTTNASPLGGQSSQIEVDITSKYYNTILTEKTDADIDGQDDKFLGPYVSYGWFEDNILNRFVARVDRDDNIVNYIRSVNHLGGGRIYQSVKIRNDSANLFTMNAQEVIIPGQFPFDLDFNEVEQKKKEDKTVAHPQNLPDYDEYTNRVGMSKLAKRISELPSFSTQKTEAKKIGRNAGKGSLAGSDGDILEFENISAIAKDRMAKLTNEKSIDKREFGYLRNLIISVNIIEEEFIKANTVEDGLQSLLDRISASCGNIWDFKIIANDDGFSATVMEENSNIEPVRSLLENPSADINTGLPKEGYKHDGLLVFPAWKTNSIVHDQQMTSKIPSGMQTAVVYGRNGSDAESMTSDNNLETKGKRLGEIFNIPGKEPAENISFKGLERILGNSDWDTNGWGNNSQSRFKEGYSNEGLVGPLLSKENRTDIDTTSMLKNYSQKQIRKVLDDGISYSKNIITSDGYSVGADSKKEYRYLYTKLGLIRKNYKSAGMYFLNNAPDSIEKTTDVLVPLEFSVTIDGTAGIYAGQCFTSTHMPQRYRDMTVFQIVNVSHSVDAGSWKTTLKGLMRIDYGSGKGVNNNEKTDVTTMLDIFNELKETKKSGVNKPPYLSFSEYLTAMAGRVGDYEFDLKKELDSRTKAPEEVKRDMVAEKIASPFSSIDTTID